MKNFNYYVEKDNETKEIIYIEYNKIQGYKLTPKTKKEDAIEVNKIVFVSPMLTEKLLKKKVEIKLRALVNRLNELDDDDDESEAGIRETLVTAERLKLTIINNYLRYIGNEYANLSLKKLQLIINELRKKIYAIREKKVNQLFYNNEEYIETKEGRKR